MSSFFRNLFVPGKPVQQFAFSRPLVVLQSDDWGRVGVRDKEGYDQLRAQGIRLGEHPYDLYSLETADDVNALVSLLQRHHDSIGRSPCVVMNFCTANLDFNRMRSAAYREVQFLPLSEGLPGKWSRPGLFDAYHAGINKGTLYPALHGLSHFCATAIEHAISSDRERARILRRFWQAETPYIYWRMPWVGFEYWNPEKPAAGFLSEMHQSSLIAQSAQNFSSLFKVSPVSGCAPGYRANRDTCSAWSKAGIRIAQNGPGSGLRSPYLDEFGILHLYRTLDFEPSRRELEVAKNLEIAQACFSRRLPLIISIHSINFHSTLKDFRSPTLAAIDAFLSAIESRYQDLLYVHDGDLHQIVTAGTYRDVGDMVSPLSPTETSRSASAGCV